MADMAWLKRKSDEPQVAKNTAGLSSGLKVVDAEQQTQERDRMEKELAEQRARRG